MRRAGRACVAVSPMILKFRRVCLWITCEIREFCIFYLSEAFSDVDAVRHEVDDPVSGVYFEEGYSSDEEDLVGLINSLRRRGTRMMG